MSRRDLLQPFKCSFKNRFFPPGLFPWKTVTAFLFGLLICIGLYLVSVRVVGYFHSQSELGIILSLKIFQMAWIIMFSMLIFSCMVSAVSSMFLSQDNEIICAAPVPATDLYAMRFVTTTIYTSWMMVVFSIPIFAGYGQVFQAGWLFWLLMPLTVVATAAIATGIGNTATIILINLFPARRTKDIVLYLSLCFGIFIYIIFRFLKPEELVNPDRFGHFVDYLSTISTPAAPYIPAAWAANLLSLYLLDREIDLLLLSLIIITPLALFFVGEWAMGRWFFKGYSKSQESFGGYRLFSSRKKYRPRIWGWIAAKETKTFLRDSAEWSQLFMIAALVIVYLYNFKMLPVQRSFFAEEYITNIISFLNIGLTGFIVASLSARFVFPSIGAEGGAFYLVRSSPISISRFLFSKYLYYVLPFTFLALLMVIISDHLLNITGPMWWFSLGTTLLITWTVVAVALGFGALHADFKAESKAAALGGMGAILFLFTAMAYEIIVICTGFFPAYKLVGRWLRHIPYRDKDIVLLGIWILFAVLSGIFISVFFFRKGVKNLQEMS
jgi:ABC-2 type transport system permease protein